MGDNLPEKRSRRATRFRYVILFVSYASMTINQPNLCFCLFSGDFQQFDISSEDENVDRVQKRTPGGNGKAKRVKECPGCGANVAVSTKECRFCDYQFTSKSLLVNQQSAAQESQAIRDRFPFEPERVS